MERVKFRDDEMKQRVRETLCQSLDRISPDALYEGFVAEGLFADKLPPVFSSRPFYEWCKGKRRFLESNATKKGTPYVVTECMRNTNVPRVMGIPNPFAYEELCRFLSAHWLDLRQYFRICTTNQRDHKVSQIHIKKMRGTASLFKMNYHSGSDSFNPLLPDLLQGNRYVLKTDIANFFPSVYSHSLVWALKTKAWAKKEKGKFDELHWQNMLDKLVMKQKYDETNGILIGPHVSNLLSEIIMARVDERLCDKFKFIRSIDDCQCYVPTREDADKFLVELAGALKEFGLSINQKKTRIEALPVASNEDWVRALNDYISVLPPDLGLGQIRACLDFMLQLLRQTNDTAVISYAMASLSEKNLTEPARLYYVKFILHLSEIYPYLYRFLDDRLFQPFGVEKEILELHIPLMYKHGLESHNFEESSFALYFSIRYGVRIDDFSVEKCIKEKDCILLCLALSYVRAWHEDGSQLHQFALELQKEDSFWENWLFIYEALHIDEFAGSKVSSEYLPLVKALKKDKVSFIKTSDEISVVYSVQWDTEFIDWRLAYVPDITSPDDQGAVNELWVLLCHDEPSYSNDDIARKYLNAIVSNLYAYRFMRKNVSIPFSQNTTERLGIIGPDGNVVDEKKSRKIFEWLFRKGYVGQRVGSLSDNEGVYYWAKNPLGPIFAKLNTACVRRTDIHPDDDVIVMKDEDKNIVPNPTETEKTQTYRAAISRMNAVYAQHRFCIDVGHGMEVQQFSPGLKAIFNNSSWDEGGRLYAGLTIFGLDYQNVPSEMRRTITIDGMDCVELDYSALHIHLLYALKGKRLDHTDPYTCGKKSWRPLVKKALLIMLNADSREVVLYKLKKLKSELYAKPALSSKEREMKAAFEGCGDVDKLLSAIERKHQDIADYFHTGVGVKLQNIDSSFAVSILSHFGALGVPVLPVHDSFIVSSSYKDELEREMGNAYRGRFPDDDCPIKEA